MVPNLSVLVGLNGSSQEIVDGAECDRVCVEGEEPKMCKFDFKVELYNTMSKVMSTYSTKVGNACITAFSCCYTYVVLLGLLRLS